MLYLLLLVFMPWLHMPMHGPEEKDELHAHGCCGHQPAESDEPQEPDDCGLCNLAIVQTELPHALPVCEALFMQVVVPLELFIIPEKINTRIHQARAPPGSTV